MDKLKKISASISDLFSVSESGLTMCSKHNKTLIKAVFCRKHVTHNTVICEECKIECEGGEHVEEKVKAEVKQYASVKEIDKKVADGCSRIHISKLCILSKLGRKGEGLSMYNSSQHIAASTEHEETLLCKEISKVICLEIRFIEEIMPFIVKKKKTPSEEIVYFWKVECLIHSLTTANLEDLETSTECEYLKQFEEFMYIHDMFTRTPDKIQRAYVYDTAKSHSTETFISFLKRKMLEEKIQLTLCEEISDIADEYEPIIVVCLLDTRYDSNIHNALSCVEAIDDRRIVFISLHCKSKDAIIEDFTKSVTAKIEGTNYEDLGMVIDWYQKLNYSKKKAYVENIIKFLKRYPRYKYKDVCRSKCTNLNAKQSKNETSV